MKQQLLFNEQISDASFKLILEYGKVRNVDNSWERNDGYLLFQMVVLKGLSIVKIAQGLEYASVSLSDPQSIFCLVRSQFEAYAQFNHIYIQSKSNEELKIKHDLWRLSSLQFQDRYDFDYMYEEMPEDENLVSQKKQFIDHINNSKAKWKAEIGQLTHEITSNPCFISLNDKNKKTVFNEIKKKEWRFCFDNNKVECLNWNTMFKRAVPSKVFRNMYNYLSSQSHPSNSSVLQFGINNLSTNKDERPLEKTGLQLSYYLMSFLIKDFCNYYNQQHSFSKLPEHQQVLVNNANELFGRN